MQRYHATNRAQRLLTPMHRARRLFRRLAGSFAADTQLCLRMLFWRVWLPFLKYAVPLRVLARLMWAEPSASSGSPTASLEARIHAVEHLVRSGGRLLVSANCLERSLMLYRLLSTIGASPCLVVGVSRQDGGVAGHTWVELDGRPVNDRRFRAFQPVMAFGPNGRLSPLPRS